MTHCPEFPPAPDHAALSAMIERLTPERELLVGKKFLRALLKEKGDQALLEFVERSAIALDKNDGLDLAYDFSADERKIFDRCRLNLFTRRHFLNTVGWGVPGAVFATTGALDCADLISGTAKKPDSSSIKDAIHHYAYPPAEALIGVALMNEAYDKWIEMKLEQMADAISELELQIQSRDHATSASRTR